MMSEENTSKEGAAENPAMEDSQKSFTQDELNSIVEKRVAKEKAKYKEFDQYKADSEELAKIKEKNKTEIEKANEKAAQAEAELAELKAERERASWVDEISKETNVPTDVLSAMRASSRDELNETAQHIKEYFTKPAAPVVNTGAPSKSTTTSGDPLRDVLQRKL